MFTWTTEDVKDAYQEMRDYLNGYDTELRWVHLCLETCGLPHDEEVLDKMWKRIKNAETDYPVHTFIERHPAPYKVYRGDEILFTSHIKKKIDKFWEENYKPNTNMFIRDPNGWTEIDTDDLPF